MKVSSNKKLALKILNELKYNKRMIYMWESLIQQHVTNVNIYKFLEQRLDYVNSNVSKVVTNCKTMYLIKKIDTKKLKNNKGKINIVSFDREKDIELDDIFFNDFIYINLDMFLLSVIWLDRVGRLIDSSLAEEIFANRISKTQNTFFELYFTAYNNYRNSAFKEMDYLIDETQEGVAIQLDIEKCFYHVDINALEKEINFFIDNSEEEFNNTNYKVLNKKIFECIKKYNEISIDNSSEIKCNLPIGFLPSNVLINFYLQKLDEKLIQELNPISYGRYVDDITIVLKRKMKTKELEKDISDLDTRIEKLKDDVFKEKEVKITFNKEKKIYFVINKTSDHNYIKKFKNKTEQLSSDFYRLIDVNELDIEIDAAYEIVENPVKLSELFEIKKDKKAITKTIAAIFYTLYAEPIKNEKINKILAQKLINKFDGFIDKGMFLEIFDYWLPLILIEHVALGKNFEIEALSSKEFEALKVIKRLSVFKDMAIKKANKEMFEFINCYLRLFEKLFLDGDIHGELNKVHLNDLLNNFTLPKFLNPMFDFGYLTYEKQLSELNKIMEKDNEVENEEQFFNNFNKFAKSEILKSQKVKGIISLDDDIIIKHTETENLIDIDFKKCSKINLVKLSQVNIYNPEERNKQFIQFSTNTDKSSETIKSLNLAAKQNTDILIFPEHGLNITDLSKLVKFVKRTEIPIIGGLDYILLNESVLNLTIAILPFPTYKLKEEFYADCAILLYPKRYPAPKEYEIFTNSSCRTNPILKRNIYIPKDKKLGLNFKFKGITHSVLNCYEATDIRIKADLAEISPDFVHMVTNNKDIDYYGSIGKTISRELMTTSTITNYSKYGGTQIFIPFKEKYKQLVSQHKGSEALHVFTSSIDVERLRIKRSDNTNKEYRQNPPSIYYKNAKGRKE